MTQSRIIFFGTPKVAARTLNGLLAAGLKVIGVVSQPDRPRGRRRRLEPTPVRRAAEAAGLPLWQPESCGGEAFIAELETLKPDLFAVVAYGQFIPKRLRRVPTLAPLNLHYSLLPAYRGAAPVNWALIEGARRTGVSVQRVARRLDAGDVLLSAALEVPPEQTAPELFERLIPLGTGTLAAALRHAPKLIEAAHPQNEAAATRAPLLRRDHGGLDFRRPARELFDRWRGLLPWPGVFCGLEGERLKVHRCRALEDADAHGEPGTVTAIDETGWRVACGCGVLLIEELQQAGKRHQGAAEFARGRRLSPPFVLESVEPRPKDAPRD